MLTLYVNMLTSHVKMFMLTVKMLILNVKILASFPAPKVVISFWSLKITLHLLRTNKLDKIRVKSWITPSFDPPKPLLKSF